MNELQTFNYQDYDVRVIEVDGEPWWVLKDVCSVLGIANITQLAQRLDEDERSMFNIGRQGECNIINESGLYSVILRSDKPEAKPFRKWITSEVIPSIRKYGSYSLPDMMITETTTLTKQERIKVMEIISKASSFTLPFVLDLASPYLSEESFNRIISQKGEKQVSIKGCNKSIVDFLNWCDEENITLAGNTSASVYEMYSKFCTENNFSPIAKNEFCKQAFAETNLMSKIICKNGKQVRIFAEK